MASSCWHDFERMMFTGCTDMDMNGGERMVLAQWL
jgi:hypothetical protein